MTGYKDHVIEMLADSEYGLAYTAAGRREIVSVALQLLHEERTENARLRRELDRRRSGFSQHRNHERQEGAA